MTHIAVIDYGMGNLHSVAKALEHASLKTSKKKVKISVTSEPKIIKSADKILLPGVGAMRDCMGEMQGLELINIIKESTENKPFLGICIGMQALMNHSQENNGVKCLDIIPGSVEHFNFQRLNKQSTEIPSHLKVPHMGWNQVNQQISHPMWHNINQDQRFYFVHSYYVLPEQEAPIAATSHYGIPFTVALSQNNIFAVQFHPEKSADAGLQFFANFIDWNGE